MKKQKILRFALVLSLFAFFTLATAFFSSCSQASGGGDSDPENTGSVAIQTTDGVRYVKNSLWQGCSLDYLTAKTSGRAASATISASDLETIVEGLNDTEIDNQYFVSETDIDITESPNCNVYIAKNVGHEIVLSFLDFPRSELAGNMKYFQMDAMSRGACSVWVDNVPEYVPPPIDDRPNSIKHMIYIIDSTDGSIYYQENSDDTVLDDWTKSLDEWFQARIPMINSDAMAMGYARYYVFSGDIYTPPVPDEPVNE